MKIKLCEICGAVVRDEPQTLAGGWVAIWHEGQSLPEVVWQGSE